MHFNHTYLKFIIIRRNEFLIFSYTIFLKNYLSFVGAVARGEQKGQTPRAQHLKGRKN